MKHFLVFIAVIFSGLFLSLYLKQSDSSNQDSRTILRVFAPNSFTKQWGPGPWLKEKFESQCKCKVEYHEASDSISLIQRIKSEPKNRAADLVLGFDQYDLELAQNGLEWKNLNVSSHDFENSIKPLLSRTNFVPYDWGVLTFVGHLKDITTKPKNFQDLLMPEFQDQISLQDPRTSTPGLQFLLWVIQTKGEELGLKYLSQLNSQVKVWGASWSMSYGLFDKNQVKLTFSYSTSPIASQIDNPQTDVSALEFAEGHPTQYEFLGIPSSCQNCDLAEKFVDLIYSKEGQKIIMEKNFMFPVIKDVKKGTLFESVPEFKTIDMTVIPSLSERERILKKWTLMRRSQ